MTWEEIVAKLDFLDSTDTWALSGMSNVSDADRDDILDALFNLFNNSPFALAQIEALASGPHAVRIAYVPGNPGTAATMAGGYGFQAVI